MQDDAEQGDQDPAFVHVAQRAEAVEAVLVRQGVRLEAEVAADEQALSDPDLYARDPDRFARLTERIARHRADIEVAELRWLEVAEMAEGLSG